MTALTAGFAALGAAMVLSVGPAIRFETAFASVEKTVDGTDFQLDQIREGIIDLSREMPIAATEIAGVAASAGQLGVETDNILVFTETMAQLGTATNLTAEQAAISMARFTNIMGTATEDVPLLGAALVHLGNNLAVTESEILNMSLRLGGAGRAIGLTEVQTFALAGALGALGVRAELGGSAMSRVMLEIADAAATSGKATETFARVMRLSVDEFKNMVENNPAQAILLFAEGLSTVEGGLSAVVQILKDTDLNSIRLRDTLTRLAGGSDQLRLALGLVADEAIYGGALLDEYGRFAETAANRIQVMKNNLTALAIDLGTPLLGPLKSFVDGISSAIQGLQDIFGPAFGDIVELVGSVADGFASLWDAVTPGEGAVAGLTSVLSGVAFAMETVLALVNALPDELLAIGTAALVASRALSLIGVSLSFTGAIAGARNLATLAAAMVGIGSTAPTMAAGLYAAGFALQGLLRIAGPAAAIGVITGVGLSLKRAGDLGEEAGNKLRTSLASAFEAGDLVKWADGVRGARAEIERLREIDQVPTELFDLSGIDKSLESVGRMALGIFGVRNEMLEARAAADSLEAALADEQAAERWTFAMERLAGELGVTTTEISQAVQATGTLNALLADSSSQEAAIASYQRIKTVIAEFLVTQQDVATSMGKTSEEVAEAGASVDWYAALFGTSAATIESAARAAGIATEDLFDNEKILEVTDALAAVIVPWQQIAAVAGTNADAIRAEFDATNALIGSYETLSATLQRIEATRLAAIGTQERLNQTTAQFEEVVDMYKRGEATFQDVTVAAGNMNAAFASLAGSQAEAVAFQTALVDSLIDLGVQGNETEADIAKLLLTWVALTNAEIAELQVEGQANLDLAQERLLQLRAEMEEEFIAKLALDEGTTPDQFRAALARGEEWAVSAFEAHLLANGDAAFATITDLDETSRALVLETFELIFGADAADALAKVFEIEQAAATLIGQEYDVNLGVDDEAFWGAIDAAGFGLEGFVAGSPYTATIEIDDSNVWSVVDAASLGLGAITTNATYRATIEADGAPARAEADETGAHIRAMTTEDYMAIIEGDPNPALAAADAASLGLLATVTRRYPPAKLDADPTGVFSGVAAAQSSINSLRGRTVTLTTVRRTVDLNSGGGVDPSGSGGGLGFFASGGIEHHAPQIAGTSNLRVWAEPETGGEAYIPLGHWKRPQSTAILSQVARMFGYQLTRMADGGTIVRAAQLGLNAPAPSAPTIVVSPGAFQFTVNANSMSPADVEAMTQRTVDRAIGDFARGFSRNARGSRTIR